MEHTTVTGQCIVMEPAARTPSQCTSELKNSQQQPAINTLVDRAATI